MTREEEIKLYLKGRNIPFNSLEANSIIEGAEWADSNPPKDTSLIKWQTGEPKEEGYYLVTNEDGWISVTSFVRMGNGELFRWGAKPIAWCKLSDIEPYKEE